nr:type VI secretion system contractile sheath small subunit [Lelliottia amnigena]
MHTSGAQKKSELRMKRVLMGNYSNAIEPQPISERAKINVNKITLPVYCLKSRQPYITEFMVEGQVLHRPDPLQI